MKETPAPGVPLWGVVALVVAFAWVLAVVFYARSLPPERRRVPLAAGVGLLAGTLMGSAGIILALLANIDSLEYRLGELQKSRAASTEIRTGVLAKTRR